MRKQNIFRKLDVAYYKFVSRILERTDADIIEFWPCKEFLSDLRTKFKDEADDKTLLSKIMFYIAGGRDAVGRCLCSSEKERDIFWLFLGDLFEYLKENAQKKTE